MRRKRNCGAGRTPEEKFWSRVNKNGPIAAHMDTPCWLWLACIDGGYGRVKVDGRYETAHRAAWFYTYGSHLDNFGLHRCDVRACVNPSHVYDGTQAENNRDRAERNRAPFGSNNPAAKLTEDDVLQIRQRIANQDKKIDIASAFSISRRTIYAIEHGISWRRC